MLLKHFQLMHSKVQYQYNLSKKEKNHIEHLLYKKMINLLIDKTNEKIGFIHQYSDDFKIWPIILDLLKNNNNHLYISELVNNKLVFNKIDELFKPFNYQYGYLKFNEKKYVNEKLDILICPVQLYSGNSGFCFDKRITNFIKEHNGYKIGYTLKNNNIEHINSFNKKNTIDFDEIIEI